MYNPIADQKFLYNPMGLYTRRYSSLQSQIAHTRSTTDIIKQIFLCIFSSAWHNLVSCFFRDICMNTIMDVSMGLLLHFCGDGHGHSHGGAQVHSHTPRSSSEPHQKSSVGRNINVRAAFIHVLGDLVQSVGVFIAALVIFYRVGPIHSSCP